MSPCLHASILEQDHPSVMTSHIVLQPRIVTQCISPPSTLKYANTVTIGISGQIEKHCPVLAGNSVQGSAASCRTHGLTIQQKERRVVTSYLGKINFLSPPVCCLRQNSCSVLCAPLPVSKLPISCSPFASNTSHLLTHSHRQGQSEDIANSKNKWGFCEMMEAESKILKSSQMNECWSWWSIHCFWLSPLSPV